LAVPLAAGPSYPPGGAVAWLDEQLPASRATTLRRASRRATAAAYGRPVGSRSRWVGPA